MRYANALIHILIIKTQDMNTSSHHQKPKNQNGGLMLNIGIGIVLGLLAALAAVFLVMRGGPFKDNQNNNALEQKGQSTDPNAPLYGTNAAPVNLGAGAASSPGEGLGALTTSGDPAANSSATAETAKPVKTPTADPVAAMIEEANQTKPVTNKPEADTKNPSKPADKPKVDATTPKEVKPTAAPKTPAAAQANGKYTIQAGAFSSAAEAAALKSKLAAQGQSASVSEKKTADGKTLYRVRTGNYNSDKEAQAARAKTGGVVLEIGK